MLNIYTNMKLLKDRAIIARPQKYFEDIVLEEIADGSYELSDEDCSLIVSDGNVVSISNNIVETKYGSMPMTALHDKVKTLIVIRYLEKMNINAVVNVTRIVGGLSEILEQAEKSAVDVLLCFKMHPNTCENIKFSARFDENEVLKICDYYENDFEGYYDYDKYFSDYRIEFTDGNCNFNLFFQNCISRMNVNNSYQKAKLFQGLKKAIFSGNIRVTKYSCDDLSAIEIPPENVLILDIDNKKQVTNKLLNNNKQYIVFHDYNDNVTVDDFLGSLVFAEVEVSCKEDLVPFDCMLEETQHISHDYFDGSFDFEVKELTMPRLKFSD